MGPANIPIPGILNNYIRAAVIGLRYLRHFPLFYTGVDRLFDFSGGLPESHNLKKQTIRSSVCLRPQIHNYLVLVSAFPAHFGPHVLVHHLRQQQQFSAVPDGRLLLGDARDLRLVGSDRDPAVRLLHVVCRALLLRLANDVDRHDFEGLWAVLSALHLGAGRGSGLLFFYARNRVPIPADPHPVCARSPSLS